MVALTQSVDSRHAPDARNESERILFRHLYETLVKIDCNGRLEAGLAESWASSDSGRVWTFTLNPEARFWDGEPVKAGDVIRSWTLTQIRGPEKMRFPSYNAATLDDRHLVVTLSVAQEDPALFADPALAVVHYFDAKSLPVGTGPFRFTGDAADLGIELVCEPNPNHLDAPATVERLVFQFRPNADPRDLQVEGGPDAFLVRDRAQLSYVESAGGCEHMPMLWDRIYVVLSPIGVAGWTPGWSREDLAHEVAVSDAQPAASILFEHSGGTPPIQQSTTAAAPLSGAATRSQIVYRKEDRDAQSLAERVTALVGQAYPEPALGPVAVGLAPAEFEAALHRGSEAAYVFGLPRRHADPRLQMTELVHAAPWVLQTLKTQGGGSAHIGILASAPPESLASQLTAAGIAVPLVFTRPHLVARHGLAGVVTDGDGALRFDRAGWMEGTRVPASRPAPGGVSPP